MLVRSHRLDLVNNRASTVDDRHPNEPSRCFVDVRSRLPRSRASWSPS